MTLLIVRRLGKSFGGVVAVSDVSFDVASGELVALIGPNGAGKSTTFNMVGGQLTPDQGTIRIDGAPTMHLPPHAIWRLGVARTFQIAQTFVSMTAAENVQMALQSAGGDTFNLWRTARNLHRTEAFALLESVGLGTSGDTPVETLAYGDVKRVELAVALASHPKLLLMDEPTAGMARGERHELMQLVTSLARSRDLGILFTEHDMEAVFRHASRVLVLVDGKIVSRGSPSEVQVDPILRKLYLGAAGSHAAAAADQARGSP